jgi:hypothetical protein
MKKMFLLPLMLMLAVVAQGQSFIGCRVDGGWAETPKLRKTFTVKKKELKRYDFQTLTFYISVTSLGYHEVYINGVKVGDRVLLPAVSQLDKRALEVSYDITDLVREGDNYNPYSYTITQKKVTSKTTLKLKMAPCGGFAVSIRERQ